jgi:hypothetical protein
MSGTHQSLDFGYRRVRNITQIPLSTEERTSLILMKRSESMF